MNVGGIEALPIECGRFRLDGGAMFGVVPKVLWEKHAPADEKNRIAIALRSMLIRTGTDLVIHATFVPSILTMTLMGTASAPMRTSARNFIIPDRRMWMLTVLETSVFH